MGRAIEKHKIIPERLWAWDFLDDLEGYAKEFAKRNPRADCMPTREKYLLYQLPKKRGIDSFNEELLEVEQLVKEEVVEKNWDCPGCGKEFDRNHIGRKNHVKACKKAQNLRT